MEYQPINTTFNRGLTDDLYNYAKQVSGLVRIHYYQRWSDGYRIFRVEGYISRVSHKRLLYDKVKNGRTFHIQLDKIISLEEI